MVARRAEKPNAIKWVVWFAVVVFAANGLAQAQEDEPQRANLVRVFLDDVVFPIADDDTVRLYFRVEAPGGGGLAPLGPADIVVRDNDRRVAPEELDLSTIGNARRGTAAVLVLDGSRSMRGQPFDQAKRAALRYLDQMGERDRVAVIAFDDTIHEVADFGTPVEDVRKRIALLQVAKKTLSKRVWDAATEGLALIVRSREALPRRVFMIVFSDGRDSGSQASPSSLLATALGGANLGRTPIFSVGYMEFGGAGLPGLDEVSTGTGAKLYELHTPTDLESFFDDVSTRMNKSYVVSYAAPHDGERHTIELAVGTASDSRDADYPLTRSTAPMVMGLMVVIAAVGFLVSRRLRRGKPEGELVIVSGAHEDECFVLDRECVRIGAYEANEIVLNFPSVSRFHAELVFAQDGAQLKDLNSKNGTFINDRRIYTQGTIRAGDRVRLGTVEMFYRV